MAKKNGIANREEFIGVLMPRDVRNRLDALAKKRSWTRSQAIVELVGWALAQQANPFRTGKHRPEPKAPPESTPDEPEIEPTPVAVPVQPDTIACDAQPDEPPGEDDSQLGPVSMDEIQLQAIVEAIARHGGKKPAAAEELGISLKTLYNTLNRHKPRREPPKPPAASVALATTTQRTSKSHCKEYDFTGIATIPDHVHAKLAASNGKAPTDDEELDAAQAIDVAKGQLRAKMLSEMSGLDPAKITEVLAQEDS